MTDELLPFGSAVYFGYLALMLFSRGMDFFSTWVATPNLALEGNPLAKWMGWRGGIIFNLVFCGVVSIWPLPAIMVSAMSLLVAARNFQNAWMMRSMGEEAYSVFIHQRLMTTRPGLFVFCIAAQSILTGIVGIGVMVVTHERSIAFAIGAGIVSYAVAVFYFSLLSIWRLRRG
jgi:hypothetical protein